MKSQKHLLRVFYGSEEERRKWQNPETILVDVGLSNGMTFIDIGCGDGFFTLPATKLVGKKGKVYGLDIDAEVIRMLKKQGLKEGLRNMYLKAGAAEETIFCETCADIVFFGIVLHDFRDPAKVILNAKTMLKPTGRLIDLDWKKAAMELGPPLSIRFSEKKAVSLIRTAGFKIETAKEAGHYHYVIIAKPRISDEDSGTITETG